MDFTHTQLQVLRALRHSASKIYIIYLNWHLSKTNTYHHNNIIIIVSDIVST